ncbi:hypothetical protein GCM10027589_06420 [Actinocorallia lasiicapitis]
MAKDRASPDDPALTDYWARRRRRSPSPLGYAGTRALRAQSGRCPACEDFLLHADNEPSSPQEWEQWYAATRTAIRRKAITTRAAPSTPDTPWPFQLEHAHCARRPTSGNTHNPATQQAPPATGLA